MPFLLAILLVAAPPIIDPRLEDARKILAEQLAVFGDLVTDYENMVDSPLIDTQIPQVGIVIHSFDVPDADKRYPVMIVATYKDAPADKAGIRPGDRLVAIGERRLDYETDAVVQNLLTGNGPIRLTTRRGSATTEHTVERLILPCFARADAAIDRGLIRERLYFMRRSQKLLLEQLESAGDDPLALNKIGETNVKLFQLPIQLATIIIANVYSAVETECRAQYSDNNDTDK